MALTLMYITNDPQIAHIADESGVDRVWIDLEQLHKDKRQKGMNTVKSNHTLYDIEAIRPMLKRADLQVRINPINENSKSEIETAIAYGADVIMLPYFKTIEEIKQFFSFVGRRVKTVLLLETQEAFERIDDILALPDLDEIHIGLNDLHLSYHMDFMFEPLANGMLDDICAKIEKAKIKFGFGGIAKLGEGMLPAEYVIAEHYRLHSTAAILSRSFYDTVEPSDYVAIADFFHKSILEIREYEEELEKRPPEFFAENHRTVQTIVKKIVEDRREKI